MAGLLHHSLVIVSNVKVKFYFQLFMHLCNIFLGGGMGSPVPLLATTLVTLIKEIDQE